MKYRETFSQCFNFKLGTAGNACTTLLGPQEQKNKKWGSQNQKNHQTSYKIDHFTTEAINILIYKGPL